LREPLHEGSVLSRKQYIFNVLIEASDPDAVKTEKLIAQLQDDEPGVDEKLGLVGEEATS
jgi:hypothetical protein